MKTYIYDYDDDYDDDEYYYYHLLNLYSALPVIKLTRTYDIISFNRIN